VKCFCGVVYLENPLSILSLFVELEFSLTRRLPPLSHKEFVAKVKEWIKKVARGRKFDYCISYKVLTMMLIVQLLQALRILKRKSSNP
jgi:hypothetical protein